eukprot:tig00000571_g2176.t1
MSWKHNLPKKVVQKDPKEEWEFDGENFLGKDTMSLAKNVRSDLNRLLKYDADEQRLTAIGEAPAAKSRREGGGSAASGDDLRASPPPAPAAPEEPSPPADAEQDAARPRSTGRLSGSSRENRPSSRAGSTTGRTGTQRSAGSSRRLALQAPASSEGEDEAGRRARFSEGEEEGGAGAGRAGASGTRARRAGRAARREEPTSEPAGAQDPPKSEPEAPPPPPQSPAPPAPPFVSQFTVPPPPPPMTAEELARHRANLEAEKAKKAAELRQRKKVYAETLKKASFQPPEYDYENSMPPGVKPCLAFYPFIVRDGGASRLRIPVPPTVVFLPEGPPEGLSSDPDDVGAPIQSLFYTPRADGCVRRVDHIDERGIADRIFKPRAGEEPPEGYPVAVLKKMAKPASERYTRNELAVLDYNGLKAFSESVSSLEAWVLQKFVWSNGGKPFVARCVHRRAGAGKSFTWMISGRELCEESAEADPRRRYCTDAERFDGCAMIPVAGKANAELQELTGALRHHMEQTVFSVPFDELVADWIKDKRGDWWFIQVKAFRMRTPGPGAPLSEILRGRAAPVVREQRNFCRGDYCDVDMQAEQEGLRKSRVLQVVETVQAGAARRDVVANHELLMLIENIKRAVVERKDEDAGYYKVLYKSVVLDRMERSRRRQLHTAARRRVARLRAEEVKVRRILDPGARPGFASPTDDGEEPAAAYYQDEEEAEEAAAAGRRAGERKVVGSVQETVRPIPNRHRTRKAILSDRTFVTPEDEEAISAMLGALAERRKKRLTLFPPVRVVPETPDVPPLEACYTSLPGWEQIKPAMYYSEVKVCRNCYRVYTAIDEARRVAMERRFEGLRPPPDKLWTAQAITQAGLETPSENFSRRRMPPLKESGPEGGEESGGESEEGEDLGEAPGRLLPPPGPPGGSSSAPGSMRRSQSAPSVGSGSGSASGSAAPFRPPSMLSRDERRRAERQREWEEKKRAFLKEKRDARKRLAKELYPHRFSAADVSLEPRPPREAAAPSTSPGPEPPLGRLEEEEGAAEEPEEPEEHEERGRGRGRGRGSAPASPGPGGASASGEEGYAEESFESEGEGRSASPVPGPGPGAGHGLGRAQSEPSLPQPGPRHAGGGGGGGGGGGLGAGGRGTASAPSIAPIPETRALLDEGSEEGGRRPGKKALAPAPEVRHQKRIPPPARPAPSPPPEPPRTKPSVSPYALPQAKGSKAKTQAAAGAGGTEGGGGSPKGRRRKEDRTDMMLVWSRASYVPAYHDPTYFNQY